MKRISKNKTGISLIVLVITIIVMIILASSIVLSLRSSGIIDRANEAIKLHNQSSELETLTLLYSDYKLGQSTKDKFDNMNLIMKMEEELPEVLGGSYISSTQIGESLKVRTSNGLYMINENGKIELIENDLPTEVVNDSRYNNEDIIITSSEQIYALGRLLMNAEIKNRLGYDSTTNSQDFALFEFPSSANTSATKIAYLQTASYRLEEDIALDLSALCTADTNEEKSCSFLGIGVSNSTVAFKGFFNGNNKTITLKSSENINLENETNIYVTYNLGLFGKVENATIFDLNINVDDDVVITSNGNNYSFGILAGNVTNTNIYNITAEINGADVGIIHEEQDTRSSILGGIIGTINEGNNIQSCSLILKNNSRLINSKNSNSTNKMYNGGIIGLAEGKIDNRNIIQNCYVKIDNSSIVSNSATDQCCVGGIAGYSVYSKYLNNEVYLDNGAVGAIIDGNTQIIEYSTGQQEYLGFAVGGILGVSLAGSSDNINNIGVEGNILKNCIFRSNNNDSKKEVLYAKEKGGSATNVGGIVGITFNNTTIDSCTVDIESGILLSERTESIAGTNAQYGSTSGGIVGRLEHTGRINRCIVKGSNLDIITRSTEKDMYTGGIVGIDIGPAHKKQISLENNIFIGNGSSNIILDVIKSDIENSGIYVGGIAGQFGYRMENCKISDTNIILKGDGVSVANKVYMGSLSGFRYDGSWQNSAKFDYDLSEIGIFDSTYSNVILQNNLESSITVNIDKFN